MQAARSDSRGAEPGLDTGGGGGRTPPNSEEALDEYAHNMAESIIQMFGRRPEEPEVPRARPDQEMLGEALAAAVFEVALREVCAGWNADGVQGSRSADGDFLNMDTGVGPLRELRPPLSHSGLPVIGSLDYPDAPPTTPLLPELERSRQSFGRKLKGGLAKVFLPSPPPPTPKEKGGDADPMPNSPRVALMEHLMHSLSAVDLARDRFEAGAKMEAFAEALSCGVVDWVFRAGGRERAPEEEEEEEEEGHLHRVAQQLAETILTSSLEEAGTSV